MVGAKLQTRERAGLVLSPGAARCRWRGIAIVAALLPLSFVLVQCGQAPNAGTLAANSQASMGDSFDDRFPKPVFRDRFPAPNETFGQLQSSDATR